jgi:hypothetical protein
MPIFRSLIALVPKPDIRLLLYIVRQIKYTLYNPEIIIYTI